MIDAAIIALFVIPVFIIAFKGENKTGATLTRRKAIIRHQAERNIRMEEMK